MDDSSDRDRPQVRNLDVSKGGGPMNTRPLEKEDSRWALTQSLLTAVVQGVIRAAFDMIFGKWDKGFF